ncbi:MAG: acetate--CoA ligase family protein [Deltaproteobacteria bacterium]|nr:acetate--CoA ligase family protein [Deltaproteobacteria bacterium]
MRLLEFDGKKIFRKYGIPVPEGKFLEASGDVEKEAAALSYPCIFKAQMLSGGRGKAGLIQKVSSFEEAKKAGQQIFAQENVRGILAEELVPIHRELFAAVALDRKLAVPVLMFTAQGGMEVESLPAEAMVRAPFADGAGWNFHRFLDLLLPLGLRGKILVQTAAILRALGGLFFEEDALSVEINPLTVSGEEKVLALDAKVTLDDGALFRHPAWREMKSFGLEAGEGLEREAKNARLSYVSIPGGSVGVIAGGAGLGMATMDAVFLQGGKPGAFIDIGGGVAEESMAEAVRIARQTEGIKGLLINVFGGINNCQIMARGIVRDLKRQGTRRVPLVVKTRGHFQEEGWAILEGNQVPVVKFGTTEEAVKTLLSLLDERKGN